MAKKAQTMDELMAKFGQTKLGFARGDKVSGIVLEITPKSLILGIGGKGEGVLEGEEFEVVADFVKTLSVGDRLTATVVVPETEDGQTLLSLRETQEQVAWEKAKEALNKQETLEVKVQSVSKGGVTVSWFGLFGFIPQSQLSFALSSNPYALVGKVISVKPIEVDKGGNRLVFSERVVSESEIIEKQKTILKEIKEGDRFSGRVTKVVDFGVFVQIEKDGIPLEGLVHLSEISWQRVSDPSAVFKEGDQVDVVVIGKEKDKLAFSIKQTQEDPWKKIAKYKVDQKVQGLVTEVGVDGVFVELEPGIEGFIHSSKIPSNISLKSGQQIEVIVEDIDTKKRKLSCGLLLKAKPVGYK